ncbi:unnamed protein product [Calicophoron daubneyi]|uniref:Glycosyltransferase family 92 protein n=1 Tax=Calicophoron daubneyi TaxID=300641 RepID=A0AAV2TRW9_CALDB
MCKRISLLPVRGRRLARTLCSSKKACFLFIFIAMLIIFNANKFKPKAPLRLEDIPIHLNDRGPMREGISAIELSENATHIHLALVVTKQRNIAQFLTLVKNILYYQGRFHPDSKKCKLHFDTLNNHHCPQAHPPPYCAIHLHLLTDPDAQIIISAFFSRFNPNGVYVHYYSFDRHEYLVRFIPDQSFPRDIFLKIAWTRILPDDVQKETGINAGVLLLHLERMRLAHWDTVSVELTKRMLKSEGRLKYPDQKVYNSFLFENKKFFYELPCQWNLVISRCHQVRKCSAVWIVSDVSKADCLAGSEKFALPGLLHICTGFKPEEQKHKVYTNPYPVRSVREFTMKELEDAFFEVYFAFRNVDERCFQ